MQLPHIKKDGGKVALGKQSLRALMNPIGVAIVVADGRLA